MIEISDLIEFANLINKLDPKGTLGLFDSLRADLAHEANTRFEQYSSSKPTSNQSETPHPDKIRMDLLENTPAFLACRQQHVRLSGDVITTWLAATTDENSNTSEYSSIPFYRTARESIDALAERLKTKLSDYIK